MGDYSATVVDPLNDSDYVDDPGIRRRQQHVADVVGIGESVERRRTLSHSGVDTSSTATATPTVSADATVSATRTPKPGRISPTPTPAPSGSATPSGSVTPTATPTPKAHKH